MNLRLYQAHVVTLMRSLPSGVKQRQVARVGSGRLMFGADATDVA